MTTSQYAHKPITMTRLLLCLCLFGFFSCGQAPETVTQDQKIETPAAETEETGYNAELAAELGADQYGMKQYVMAFLKAGPNRSQDSLEAAQLQKAHLENIGRMAEAGQLALAGPFLDGGELRGIYVFNVKSLEEAKALTETDPAIQAGRLVLELHPWYGSAALMKVGDIHATLAEKSVAD
ncbi:MAG: hypothetical protein DHS20C18_14250 [Saprospiraceae bacterium]|nr:MAG: hypothetical protein DHS20C18_14250 [Saprospiraceae bacterium]